MWFRNELSSLAEVSLYYIHWQATGHVLDTDTLSPLYSNEEYGNKPGTLASCYTVWEPRTQKYINPVCINTLLRINELDFTAGVDEVAESSCFQSNELLLTSNYNSLSVREPWYDTRQAPPVR